MFADSAPEDQKSVKDLIDDLHRKALQAMKRCDPDAVWLVIENVNHPWYRVHLRETPDHIEDWPVELLPYGDPCYLVADDFKCGFLADLDHTISVFGAQLLDAIHRDLPMVFTKIVGRE